LQDLVFISLHVDLERIDLAHERVAQEIGGPGDEHALLRNLSCGGSSTQVIVVDR
jgi:hypothetical protein